MYHMAYTGWVGSSNLVGWVRSEAWRVGFRKWTHVWIVSTGNRLIISWNGRGNLVQSSKMGWRPAKNLQKFPDWTIIFCPQRQETASILLNLIGFGFSRSLKTRKISANIAMQRDGLIPDGHEEIVATLTKTVQQRRSTRTRRYLINDPRAQLLWIVTVHQLWTGFYSQQKATMCTGALLMHANASECRKRGL